MTEAQDQQLVKARSQGIALVSSSKDTQSVMRAVAEAKAKGFNVLTPATLTETLPPGTALSIRMVASRGERDFYKTGNNKYAPSGKLLDRIAQAAGIRWRVDLIRRLDDRRDPYYAVYEAVGVAPDPATGEPRMMKGTKSIDLRDGSPLCEEMIENARASKYNKTEEQAQAAAAKAIRQKRKFINELAETGARLRVIRALLSIDSDLNEDEIKRDFVIVSLDTAPDPNDREAVQRHADESRRIREAMYYGIGMGNSQQAKPLAVEELPDEPMETREAIEAEVVRRPTEEAPELPSFTDDEIPFDDDEVPF